VTFQLGKDAGFLWGEYPAFRLEYVHDQPKTRTTQKNHLGMGDLPENAKYIPNAMRKAEKRPSSNYEVYRGFKRSRSKFVR
jgi:hypothetical protein